MAEIESVAVIGAGRAGWQIAAFAALAGYTTILEDILPASLRRAENGIRVYLDQLVALGLISNGEVVTALARLQYSGSVEEAARQAGLVIESVPDEAESKLEIFALLDRMAKPHTILATTATSLGVAEIVSITYRASTILGLRFSPLPERPVKRLDHLEIVRTRETDDEAVAALLQFGRRLAERVVVVAESPTDGPRQRTS